MEKIIDIWSALDNDSHILKLQTYDRYGNFISDVSNAITTIKYSRRIEND